METEPSTAVYKVTTVGSKRNTVVTYLVCLKEVRIPRCSFCMSEELPLAWWTAGLVVLTVGILVPFLFMASEHRLLPASWTSQSDAKAS